MTAAAAPSQGGRALALLLIGLFTGAMGSLIALRALQQKASYSEGLMAVLQHETEQLRRLVRSTPCPAAEIERARLRIDLLAADIPAALSDSSSAVLAMTADLKSASAAPINDCSALPVRLQAIEQACKACHSQMR